MLTSSCIWSGSLHRGCLIRHACPVSMLCFIIPVLPKVSKGAKIRNGYNQVPYQCEFDKLTVGHHKRSLT